MKMINKHTTVCKTQQTILKTEQHEPHTDRRGDLRCSEFRKFSRKYVLLACVSSKTLKL